MKVGLFTLPNTCGLEKDAQLVADELASHGHHSVLIHGPHMFIPTDQTVGRQLELARGIDCAIMFEQYMHPAVALSHNFPVIWIPNVEQLFPGVVPPNELLGWCKLANLCVAKTAGVLETIRYHWPAQVGCPVRQVTWTTPRASPSVATVPGNCLLHFGGASIQKNTVNSVLAALRVADRHPEIEKVICHWRQPSDFLHGVSHPKLELYTDWISDNKRDELYRRARLSIHASSSEGFGLTIIESLERGVPVITTDGVPMRELVEEGVTGWLCHPQGDRPRGWGKWYDISPEEIERVLERALAVPVAPQSCLQAAVRRRARFSREFSDVILPLVASPPSGRRRPTELLVTKFSGSQLIDPELPKSFPVSQVAYHRYYKKTPPAGARRDPRRPRR